MSKRMFARAGALLGAAVMSAGVLVAVASPAQAASLGTITLSQTSGTVAGSPMFANATTSAACPTGYGENAALRVGRPGGPYSNLAPALGGGGYDTAPISVGANRSFTTALGGTAPAAGTWWVIVECFSLTLGRHADEFQIPIEVTGGNWAVDSGPEATTTTLAVSPSGTIPSGATVTLTATVSPGTATGTVEFRRGSTVVGSAPVGSGTATLTATLPAGTHSLTAVFTPATGADFLGSTSSPVSVTVEGPPPGGTEQEIVADITPGAFSLTVAGNTTSLTGGVVGGAATGNLQTATVTDQRGSNAGWTLTGQLEDFNTVPATTTIPNSALTWTPSAAKTSGSGTVTAGAAGNLGAPRTLASAASGGSAGVFTAGAGLSLAIPDTANPGSYAATLTLTLA
ncbi:Ig-like domain-containing protein [Phytohabitans rumicis]|uniref:Bacterial Ig-like domain-containing protein n=1 Tax=Phytohabitans rumicis TaxID=1076125 RepID=A0A6V8KMW0_9ACTN|nr:Ig-like domain-containing protein [Phytohabitans rumicis]GFJ86512.1 hypothetical protein Prum_001540 [Phytohabitans rumicis]